MEHQSPSIQENIGTQKKLAELEQQVKDLLRENAEYRKLYEESPFNYQSLDEDGNFINVNQTWLTNLGYSREEVIGHNFSEFLDQNWQSHFQQNFPRLKSLGEVMGVEFKMVKRNGEKILVSLHGHIGKGNDGRFQQTYCVFQDITQQRLLELALEKSEERFRLAMDASNDGIWDWNLETGEVYFSPGYPAQLGFPDDDFPSSTDFWLERIHPDDRGKVSTANSNCVHNHCDNINVEFRIRARDGQYRWILGRGMAVGRDANGKALRLIGTLTDITRQKKLEDKLRVGQSKMQSIFRAAPIGIGVVSQRVFTEVNDHFCKMIGYSKSDLLQQNSRILYCSDEEFERVGAEKYRAIDKTGTGSVETRFKRKDGTIIDVFLSSSPLNRDDLSDGVSFTVLDITEARQAELKLRQSEEKYRNIMESMIDPVYICSSDLKISFMNQAMIKRVGRDATGENCYQALHNLNARCSWCHFFANHSVTHHEIDIISPHDDRHYHICSSPIKQPDGSVSKLSVYRDTTELHQIQNQLQQAQKMEAIGNLAGGIAHDFNNILSVIIGYGEMALNKLPAENSPRSELKMVLKASERATDLVKHILTFSRRNSQEKKPVRILLMVKEAMKMMRSSLPSSIHIKLDFHLKDEMVLTDLTGINQIVINLCTNALHAMKDQKGILNVSLRQEVVDSSRVSSEWLITSGPFVVLTVEDSGEGMDEKIKKRIFDPYFTTKKMSEGTGLGLAVVHGIVKDCNGFIEVESTRGIGSKFSVFLPLFEQELSKISDKTDTETLPTGDEHILFIDDEISLCEIGKKTLEKLGYRVTALSSSQDAFNLFRADPDNFDLIVSDQTMPEMTGSSLALEVFKLRPSMPYIICTGYSSAITKEEILAIGISSFLEKPVQKNILANTVRAVLDK